ncbi:hypothetical protein V6Z11_D11G027700 [Gossypium hirsutum]
MASGWIKYLQCKSRVFEDKSDPKLVPRAGGKPEPDLSYPPPRPRRIGSSSTPARPVRNHDTVLPALTELAEGHPSRNVVEIIFHASWSPRTFTGRIDMIFKVQSRPRTVTRFEEYRETVKTRSGSRSGCSVFGDEENARCVADRNEVLRFRCLGPASGDCGVNDSWLLSDGKGETICTYAGNGGAHESAGGGKGRRAMLRMGFGYESSMDGRTGYDSVCGDNGELLEFDPRAVLPCFLIIYKL